MKMMLLALTIFTLAGCGAPLGSLAKGASVALVDFEQCTGGQMANPLMDVVCGLAGVANGVVSAIGSPAALAPNPEQMASLARLQRTCSRGDVKCNVPVCGSSTKLKKFPNLCFPAAGSQPVARIWDDGLDFDDQDLLCHASHAEIYRG